MLASVSSTYSDILTSVFSSTIAAKAWLASAAGVLALVQISTGARIFGKIKRFVRIPPPYVNRIHRWSGRIAVLLTLPIAFHCIFILGFQSANTRVLLHSILGTIVYGVIAVKLFFVHDPDHPRKTLPIIGSALFATIAGLWLTSSLWYFTNVRFGF
jgi:Family of unknown function (DUF6529)